MSGGTITLADGTVISMQTGRKVREQSDVPSGFVSVPTNAEAVAQMAQTRRRISDLPDVPERMNTIGLIVAYHMFGLAEHEIAQATGLPTEQIGRIKMTEAFSSLHEELIRGALRGQGDNVRSMIEASAVSAVQTMQQALHSDSEQVQIVAAKDILDRAGHRPVDVTEHRHKIEGGLVIEYVRKNEDDKLPTIDITPVDVP